MSRSESSRDKAARSWRASRQLTAKFVMQRTPFPTAVIRVRQPVAIERGSMDIPELAPDCFFDSC
jgi:hypothetical protein